MDTLRPVISERRSPVHNFGTQKIVQRYTLFGVSFITVYERTCTRISAPTLYKQTHHLYDIIMTKNISTAIFPYKGNIMPRYLRHFYCYYIIDVQGQLDVSSFPSLLFDGGSHGIVEGSVVWLYCEVNSTSPSLGVTWNKDSVPLVQDVPHVRIRTTTSTTTTTSILIVDNFQDSLPDGGVYQCIAQDQGTTGNGTALTLTGTVAYKLDNAD